MSELVSPSELKKIADQIELQKARQALEKEHVREAEKQKLHDAFFQRDVLPDAKERVSAAVRRAAEGGQKELLALTFPSSWTSDNGRRINNLEADWPTSLEGYAKRAYDFYIKEMHPHGYKLRAEILNYPGGMPGDVGLFLSW